MRSLLALLAACGAPPAPAVSTVPISSAQPLVLASPPAGGLFSYALRDGMVVRVDLEAERIEPVAGIPRLDVEGASGISSLAEAGDHLFACARDGNGDGQLVAIDLTTKQITVEKRGCEAIASDGRRIWVRSTLMEQKLDGYDGVDAFRAGDLGGQGIAPHPSSRLGTGADRILAAWHSSDHIFVIDPGGGQREVKLAGYNGWIFGLAAAGDQLFVVGGWVEKGIRVFDLQSGALVRTLFADQQLHGLTMPRRR